MGPTPGNCVNPIISGFAPDPSVILVDDTFFLVTSSFHVFPGLPIYASKDLTSWKHIGNAIHRKSQLSLKASGTDIWPLAESGEVMLATGGLYAPTIRHYNGTIYIVCTNVVRVSAGAQGPNEDRTENFIVSTKDIWSGEWSDPIYFEFNGIDPSIFLDDDGLVYIQGSRAPGPKTEIHLFEVDLSTGKKLSEQKKIWGGTGGIYPEGPHLYKKDGYYYLVISEGGTHEGHMITCARSKNIWGPYEAYEGNPILTAKGTNEYIQYTGHGDLFQDRDGKWWAVCLGVRLDEGRTVMGRESFLTGAEWLDGGWPNISRVRINPALLNGAELTRQEGIAPLASAPSVDYLYIRDPKLENYNFSDDGKTIRLIPDEGSFNQSEQPITFIGKRQRALIGQATVTMENPLSRSGSALQAGMAYYKDEHRFLKIYSNFDNQEIVFETINKAKDISRTTRHAFELGTKVRLRVEYSERSYCFSYQNKDGWIAFESLDTLELSGPDFVGPIIGVFAIGKEINSEVVFRDLVIE
ncbi:putative xylosidase/arabinosidase [Bisporella sp. PMI_857]|nr:putative xylosidase/arabinosidase [Bisporella sp. PMI_857]